MKPIAIFVWWLSNRANRIEFQKRAELRHRVEAAARGGWPVLFASNHLSMFDDPVLPMALYRMGFRADAEFSALTALLVACWVVPASAVPPVLLRGAALAWAVVFGARKVWWSLEDLVNFSGASGAAGQAQDRAGAAGHRRHRRWAARAGARPSGDRRAPPRTGARDPARIDARDHVRTPHRGVLGRVPTGSGRKRRERSGRAIHRRRCAVSGGVTHAGQAHPEP
jgi:hypothetical protein